MAQPVTDTNPEWHGEAVTIRDVLTALTEIRNTFAHTEAGDDEHPHPRNCVMTLVTVATNDSEERLAVRASQAISSQRPAQAVVIREDPGAPGQHLDAWITTEVQRPEMWCATECEVITLNVRGAAADHLGALVDPLLVSGVPTYLWWMGTPPFGSHELRDALQVADALVVDSARFARPYHSFVGLSDTIAPAHKRLGMADLHWARLDPRRETIAQFFAPIVRRSFLSGINEIGIDYTGQGRGNRVPSSVLIGWIASALGWKLQRASGGAGGAVAAQYEAE